MLVVEPGAEPDDDIGLEPLRVGQNLAEMAVVGGSELRLDHHRAAGAAVAAHEVGAEPPHRGLPRQRFEIEPERVAETAEVVRHHQPGDEVGPLVLPDGGGVDGFEKRKGPTFHRAVLRSAMWGQGHEKGRRNLRRPHFSTMRNVPQNASRVKNILSF